MSYPPIIGLLGKSRVGKDTFANIICDSGNFKVERLAASLKVAAIALYGFTHDQLEGNDKEVVDSRLGIRPRDAMIQLTKDTMAFMGTDFFTKRFWERLDTEVLNGRKEGIIIPDVRYEHDLTWIRERGGIIVKIVRDGPMHDAENHIECIGGEDYLFNNTGSLSDFQLRVRTWWALHMQNIGV